MLFFLPDPSHEDIKAFMDDDQRDYWDTQKGTPKQRTELWQHLEEYWRSIPDPTEAELKQVMGQDWTYCQQPETREGTLDFYRRKWKKDRKAAALARRAEETTAREEAAKRGAEKILLSLEDNTITPQEIQLPLEDALDPTRNAPQSKSTNDKVDDSEQPNKGVSVHGSSSSEAIDRPHFGVPFPNLTERQIRQDRMWRAIQSGSDPDPEDIAEEEAEALRHRLKVAEARERKRKEVESEFPSIAEKLSKEYVKDASRTSTQAASTKNKMDKLTAFLEGPFFLGGVGVVVAILALVFWGALFILAAVLFIAAVIRADFFEHHIELRRIGNFGLCALIVIAIFAFWYFVPNPFAKASVPAVSTSPSITIQPGNTASPLSVKDARILIDVKPEYLIGLYKKYSTAQANQAVKTYIGKWAKISGEVVDVDQDADRDALTGHVDPSVMITTKIPTDHFHTHCRFEEQRWIDRALVLRRGEKITLFGRITRIDEQSFSLEKCDFGE